MPFRDWSPFTRGLLLVAAGAWAVTLSQDLGLFLPTFCAMTVLTPKAALASLDLALAMNSPGRLVAGWALMLAAMMSPLLAAPLLHVHSSSLPRRRVELMVLFVIAYGTVWMAAGAVLTPLALLLRLSAPSPWIATTLALLSALAWHVSPARQRCLNRRHSRPPLPAFGTPAALSVARFGVAQGVWCVGACWHLMLLPLTLQHAHLPAMAAVALWQIAEHIEPPGPPVWAWRWPRTAATMLAWRVRNAWSMATPSPPSAPAR